MSKDELKNLINGVIDDMDGSDTFKLEVKRPTVEDGVDDEGWKVTKSAPYKTLTLVITRHDRASNLAPVNLDKINLSDPKLSDLKEMGRMAREATLKIMAALDDTSICCHCARLAGCSKTYDGAEPEECKDFKEKENPDEEAD